MSFGEPKSTDIHFVSLFAGSKYVAGDPSNAQPQGVDPSYFILDYNKFFDREALTKIIHELQ